MPKMWVQSLDWEDPPEEEIATHSSILAWKIPWTGEPGRPGGPRGRKRVRRSCVSERAHTAAGLLTRSWRLSSPEEDAGTQVVAPLQISSWNRLFKEVRLVPQIWDLTVYLSFIATINPLISDKATLKHSTSMHFRPFPEISKNGLVLMSYFPP